MIQWWKGGRNLRGESLRPRPDRKTHAVPAETAKEPAQRRRSTVAGVRPRIAHGARPSRQIRRRRNRRKRGPDADTKPACPNGANPDPKSGEEACRGNVRGVGEKKTAEVRAAGVAGPRFRRRPGLAGRIAPKDANRLGPGAVRARQSQQRQNARREGQDYRRKPKSPVHASLETRCLGETVALSTLHEEHPQVIVTTTLPWQLRSYRNSPAGRAREKTAAGHAGASVRSGPSSGGYGEDGTHDGRTVPTPGTVGRVERASPTNRMSARFRWDSPHRPTRTTEPCRVRRGAIRSFAQSPGRRTRPSSPPRRGRLGFGRRRRRCRWL